MNSWHAARIASAAGAKLIVDDAVRSSTAGEDVAGVTGAGSGPGPLGAAIDSRGLARGQLFVGLRGERVDGGAHAVEALRAGAWGVLVAPQHAEAAVAAASAGGRGAAVLVHADPLAGLQALAGAWRRELGARGAKVVAITGSTGKTSTKDILAALAGTQRRVAASPENLNTGDRPAAGGARGAARHRGAGARDGDARLRPDRRADGDRRAECGRDRQRRAGTPGAARHARGDRRRQGRADRGPGSGKHGRAACA